MSDFLGSLAARSLGTARGIRPRVLPMFAERETPGMRDPETSFDLDYAARDTGQQRSPAPATPQPDRLDTLGRPLPQGLGNRPDAQHPAPDSHVENVRASSPHPAQSQSRPKSQSQSEPEDLISGPPRSAGEHRSSVEAMLSPAETTLAPAAETVRPARSSAATPTRIVEQPAAAGQPQAHLAPSAPPRPRKPSPSPAAEIRDQPPSLAPRPFMPVPAHTAALPELTIQAAASAPPAHAVHLHASDLPSVSPQTESKSAELRRGRPAPFATEGARRTRSLQSLRQLNREAAGPAEPDIHITIGRVDVRATLASPAQEKRNRSTSSLQLADYLKRRDGSGAA